FQVTPKVSHLYAMKRIFRYLKGQPKLGLWYPRDSPFNLEAFLNSDYARASLDRKSTTGGCQFLGKRLILWQCKKQTVVANSKTEAEYVVAANCYGHVLWIQNQMLEDSYEKRLIQVIKIHTDHNVADLLTKAFDVSSDEFGVRTGSCKVNAARQDLVLLGKKFVDQHNMVACFERTDGNVVFHQIVDFLTTSPIHYALTMVTPLFASMLVLQVVEGEGLGQPFDPQPPSSTAQPSHEEQVTTNASQPQNTHTPRRTKRGQDTKIPQSSGPPKKVGDEAVCTGEDDRVVRAATTATRLEAEQESGNINKTRSVTTLNEPSPQGTSSGSGPRFQDTTLGDAYAQTRFETTSKQSHDPPLSEVNTSRSGEDSMEHQDDLMYFLPPTPHDSHLLGGHLEVMRTAQDLVIKKLQKKVKRLKKKQRVRTLRMNLFKSRMLVEMIAERKRFFAAQRAAEQTSKLPTKDHIRNRMCTYLKNQASYKHNQLKGMSYDDIQKLFDIAYKQVNSFVPMDLKVVKDSGKKDDSSSKQVECKKKRTDEDRAIKYETLAVKSLIINWETQLLGCDLQREDLSCWKITRADGSFRFCKVFLTVLKEFVRQDLFDLHRLVMEMFKSVAAEGYDLILWGDQKTMIEPNEEDEV
nr:putative ribonuclease H-like domain-containing protein [Tanacetum cinerariifolium]